MNRGPPCYKDPADEPHWPLNTDSYVAIFAGQTKHKATVAEGGK